MSGDEELHAAITAYLRRQRPSPPPRRRSDPHIELRDAAIYARVAGLDRHAAASLSAQIEACRAFTQARGEMPPLVFAEVADGWSLDRPRLAELRAAIAQGWIATVLVTSLDRLTRDHGLLLAIIAEWEAVRVALVVTGG